MATSCTWHSFECFRFTFRLHRGVWDVKELAPVGATDLPFPPATPFGRLADSADISQQDTMADEAVDIFKVFDKDFDGKLQALEMHQALGAAGLCAAIEDVQLALKEAGESGGDLQCFQKLLQQFQSTKPTSQTLQPLFKVIDPASSGRVDTSALRYLLMNFNEKLSDAEATEFMELLKLPKEGLVEIADICSRLEKSLQ
ncbi:calmodulin CAM2 [Cyclospora cayetanensis]|uniref:Calmodulin n=1 Tax=Cyclospora cayetanensis TaxID=88456 RepID=A0A1D3CZ36_9EIME|nr:calmodulin CAM2 [Cyclospora cayetanensis]